MPAEPAQDVRRRASQKRFHLDSAANAQITPRSRTRWPQPQRLARFHYHRRPQHSLCSIHRRSEVRARQRNDGPVRKHKRPAEQRHFQPGRSLRVAYQSISQPQRHGIRRPGSGNTLRPESLSPQILHGREQPRLLHLNHAHSFSNAANRSAEVGANRTRSPIASRLKPARSSRNIATGVRPINLHPPGVANGYTPV